MELDIDGKTIELPNPPAPIEVLPGTHLVRVHLPPYAPVERLVVLGKGEKNHVVRIRFAREPDPVPPAPPPTPSSQPERARPVQPLTYALAGGAVAALATSGILLASALSARDEALERCAPNCTEAERDSIDARLLAADIVGAAGIVLGGFAVYTFVTRPTVESRAFTPRFGITHSGPRFFLEGQF